MACRGINPSVTPSTQILSLHAILDMAARFYATSLANFHPINCASNNSGGDFAYIENTIKCARIVNQCYASHEYRKVGMTYYDAGDSICLQ